MTRDYNLSQKPKKILDSLLANGEDGKRLSEARLLIKLEHEPGRLFLPLLWGGMDHSD